MFTETQIGFIGSGVMGEAMVKGLLAQELLAPRCIVASDPRPERLAELSEQYGVQVAADNMSAARDRDIVVLAVKPQVLGEVLKELGTETIKPGALVLSIVAGATIERIARGLNHQAIVRVMPNTPAQIGMGMSVWTATPATGEAQRQQTRAILAALGEEFFVDHEDYLDMATALSGTGPAYIFLVMEALIDAGVHMGFPRWIAERQSHLPVRSTADHRSGGATGWVLVLDGLRRKTVKSLKSYGIFHVRNQCSGHTERPDPGS